MRQVIFTFITGRFCYKPNKSADRYKYICMRLHSSISINLALFISLRPSRLWRVIYQGIINSQWQFHRFGITFRYNTPIDGPMCRWHRASVLSFWITFIGCKMYLFIKIIASLHHLTRKHLTEIANKDLTIFVAKTLIYLYVNIHTSIFPCPSTLTTEPTSRNLSLRRTPDELTGILNKNFV